MKTGLIPLQMVQSSCIMLGIPPKQTNWITNWNCPISKERLLEEYCKMILMNRVRGRVVLILLPSNDKINNNHFIPL